MEAQQVTYAEQQERQQLINEIRELLRSPKTQRGYHLFLAEQNSEK